VPGARVTTAEAFQAALTEAINRQGPSLIEAVL